MSDFDSELDASGLNCPLPILRAKKAISALDAGQTFYVHTRGSEPLVLVSDRGNDRLQYFTLDGEHVRFGAAGIVRKPCSTVQYQDEVYIPDLYSRLTVLDKDDQLACHLGERDDGWKIEGWPNIDHGLRQDGNFTSPHDLHVDGSGNIYVAEWIDDGRVTKLTRA